MRKTTVFISSVLTTFTLVILFGVVKAYQSNAINQAVEVAVQPAVSTMVPTDIPTTAPSVITPEEAAQLAVQIIGHDNLLSAETSNFNGVGAYLITFTNKDVVYVGLDGQVLSVQVAPVFVNVALPPKNNNNNNQSNNNSSSNQDDHDDDEDHDD